MVPVVIADPRANDPPVWVLPMVMTLAAEPPMAIVLTPVPPVPRFMLLAAVLVPMLIAPAVPLPVIVPESIVTLPELVLVPLPSPDLSVNAPVANAEPPDTSPVDTVSA